MSLLRRMFGMSRKDRAQRIKETRRNLLGEAFESLEDRRMMAAFTAGDIVVERIGGTTSSATAVFLDEYTPAGAFVQSVAAPTSDSGAQQTLTDSGSATSNGYLSRSADGQYLVVPGYDAAVGTASVAGSNPATINRTIGRVGTDGVFDTTTTFNDGGNNNFRSAASVDGSSFYMGTGAGSVRYTAYGATGASTQLSTSPTNVRNVTIQNDQSNASQLYVSSGSGTTRIATVGTGLPTTSGQTIANVTGVSSSNLGSPYGYFFADLDAGVAGPDTLFVADDGLGLLKFSLVGGTWTLNNTIGVAADAYRGLIGQVSGGNVTLYATRQGSTPGIVSLTDTSGYNANNNGTPNLLVALPASSVFRGVAFTPEAATSNAPPTFDSGTDAFNAVENQAAVGTVSATDPESDTLTYGLGGGADDSFFNISSNTGAVTFKSAPDFENPLDTGGNNVYNLIVTVSDGVNAAVPQAVAVTVTDINDQPPTALDLSRTDVDEDLAVGHMVGTFSTTDGDASDTFSYTFATGPGDDDNGSFTIGGGANDQLLTGASFNFEAKSSYSVLIRTTDGEGSHFDQAFTIAINDTNEAPVFTSSGTFHANENQTAAGTLAASDPENASLTYSLKDGSDAQFFTVDSGSGAVMFKSAPNFESPKDADHDGTYSFRVKVTDGVRTTIQNLSVVVDNVVEQPVLTLASSAPDYTLGQTSFRLDSSASLSAPDSGNFNGGVLTVKITSGGDVGNRLFVGGALTRSGANIIKTGVGVVATYTGGTGINDLVITFNGNASPSIAQEMVRAIAFKTDSSYLVAPRTVSFDLTDGIGGAINTKTTTFGTVAPNADIVLGLPTSSVGYTQNGASAIVAADLTLTAYSTTSFNGGVLTVKVTDGISNANRLFVGGSFVRSGTDITLSGVLVATYNNNGGVGTNDLVITFTSNATKDIVKQLARSIAFKTYNGTGITPPDRSVSFQLTDSLNNMSNEVVKTINVSP